MKATTKFQIKITDLAKKLSPLTKSQKNWAIKNCFVYKGFLSKKGIMTCLFCGSQIENVSLDSKTCRCPSCKTKLQKEITQKRKYDAWNYFTIIDRIENYQVIRNFKISAFFQKGKAADIYQYEVCQFWIDKNGKYEIYSLIHNHNYYLDTWTGTMEIRNKRTIWKYDIPTDNIQPKIKLIPELIKKGFDGNFCELTALNLFTKLLASNKIETLLKAGYHNFITFNRLTEIERLWPSIKICIRNKYKASDVGLWIDYIDQLTYFGKDILNAKYVCPEDLQHQHQHYTTKRRISAKKMEILNLQKNISSSQIEYYKQKCKYFGLVFGNENITVSVIQHVKDFYEISKQQQHCLFSNKYYEKVKSLIMIARKGESILETIEISLDDFKIKQSRGLANKFTPAHEEIIELVNKNMPRIIKLATAS